MKYLIIFVLALFATLELVESIFNGISIQGFNYGYTPKIETKIRINRKMRTITCSGTLLTKSLIVTTAKCIRSNNKVETSIYVVLSNGEISIVKPLQMLPSPKFNISTLENNIGAVVIPQVSGIKFYFPVQLPARSYLNTQISHDIVVLGWGRPRSDSPSLNVLQSSQFILTDSPNCNIAPMNPETVKLPRPSDICIPNSGFASCLGDEGAGMYADPGTGYFFMIGVFSFTAGNGKCEDNNNAVYVRVDSHYDWLKNLSNVYP